MIADETSNSCLGQRHQQAINIQAKKNGAQHATLLNAINS